MLTPSNSFVQVSPDCPATCGTLPESEREQEPVHVLQYELLSTAPYRLTNEELIFQVHVRRLGLTATEVASRRNEIWPALFAKPHPCMRASMLPKRYGWGVHSDAEGRLALVGLGSDAYRRLKEAGERGEVRLTVAMRNARA